MHDTEEGLPCWKCSGGVSPPTVVPLRPYSAEVSWLGVGDGPSFCAARANSCAEAHSVASFSVNVAGASTDGAYLASAEWNACSAGVDCSKKGKTSSLIRIFAPLTPEKLLANCWVKLTPSPIKVGK